MVFRKDINGLRAIAVLAVVIFHYNSSFLPGGFAGVDVFFVISGFLMTKIVLKRLDNENFYLMKFYSARAKRIIPALSVTCLLSLAIGWITLLPKDFFELSRNAISSMLFYSNYWYASKDGYFDPSAADNILLHTWSLSAEWQFYIIYPIALSIFHRAFGGKTTRVAIIIGALSSLIACNYISLQTPIDSYFFLNSRAWEMLAGGIAYIINEKSITRIKSTYVEAAGIAMILFSFLFFDKNTLWPGYCALFPVIGTILVICSERDKSLFTSSIISQSVGKISYSLYLIHWPLITFIKKLSISINFAIYFSLTLIASLILYILIEKRANSSRFTVPLFIIPITLAFYVSNTEGAANRVPEELRLTSEQFQRRFFGGYGYKTNEPYLSHTKDSPEFIFFGDSYAAQYAKSIDTNGIKSVNIFFHGCPIMPNFSRYRNGHEDLTCSKAYGHLGNALKKYKRADVVFASAWDNYKDFLIKRGGKVRENLTEDEFYDLWIDQLKLILAKAESRKFYIIGRQISTNSNSYSCLAQNVLPGLKLFSTCSPFRSSMEIKINEKLKHAFRSYENVTFIDPNNYLCSDKGCLVTMGKNPAYIDGSHLSIFGANLVFSEIHRIIKH